MWAGWVFLISLLSLELLFHVRICFECWLSSFLLLENCFTITIYTTILLTDRTRMLLNCNWQYMYKNDTETQSKVKQLISFQPFSSTLVGWRRLLCNHYASVKKWLHSSCCIVEWHCSFWRTCKYGGCSLILEGCRKRPFQSSLQSLFQSEST